MTGWLDSSWQQLRDWAHREAVGIRAETRLILTRAECLQQAIQRSEGIAAERILRNFSELDLHEVIHDIFSVLRQCLIVMITSTGGGALIGGIAGGIGGAGVGAIPGIALGAAAGAEVGEWILVLMGLKALTEYIVHELPSIARTYRDGLRQAWLAAAPPPLPQQQVRVDAFALQSAAATLARGHVAMFVLLLMGIVAYLAKGRGSLGELADNVRNSKLGPKFAEWMVRNEAKLKAEPRLRPRVANAPDEPPLTAKPKISPTQRPRPPAASKPTTMSADKPAFRGTIKYRSAKDANTELFDLGIADPAHPPFKPGTQVTERMMLPGEKVNMLVDTKQLAQLNTPNTSYGLGGWGSPGQFHKPIAGPRSHGHYERPRWVQAQWDSIPDRAASSEAHPRT